MSERCENCRWFQETEQYVIGSVKYPGACMIRSAPLQVVVAPKRWWKRSTVYMIPFPPRELGDWCGEFQPKDKTDD